MKQLLALLLFTFTSFAQSSKNISVVSAEKMNIVYRGVSNPIKIVVPGAKSFTATAPGLVKADSLGTGNYKLNPGSGSEVKVNIDAVMEDGSKLHEEKIFRVKGLPAPVGTFYGDYCNVCKLQFTKQELIDGIVEVELKDFYLINGGFKVISFDLIISEKKIITNEGNSMNEKSADAIRKLKKGNIVTIDHIRYGNDARTDYRKVVPISIIVD